MPPLIGRRGEVDRDLDCKPPIVVVSEALDESVRRKLLDALVGWIPDWGSIYGAFKSYYFADVQSFFRELDQLSEPRESPTA